MPKPLPKILPCPWNGCKAEPTLWGSTSAWPWVECTDAENHSVVGPARNTARQAIEAWNKGVKR